MDDLTFVCQAPSSTSSPLRVELRSEEYFVCLIKDEYSLLSAVCPHKGGIVKQEGQGFRCPLHDWAFDFHGACLTTAGERLAQYPLIEIDGGLYVDVAVLPPPSVHSSVGKAQAPDDVIFELHAHACMSVHTKDFSVLMDPWLSGPAFLGAWMHYPPPSVEVNMLSTSAILITHEHSDHFHVPTLNALDRSTPIYFPAFPNGRMESTIESLGFKNRCPMQFGVAYELTDRIEVTFFAPQSLWNDSILLIQIDDFKILNLNDAGVNRRIQGLVTPVSVLLSTFSPGASGFPATWGNFSEPQKRSIYKKAASGKLAMLRQAADFYKASYLIPFASFFCLYHPSHLDFDSLIVRNTPDKIKAAFSKSRTEVVPLLPGESWKPSAGNITKKFSRNERGELFRRETIRNYALKKFQESEFMSSYPTDSALSAEEVKEYILSFNRVPERIHCEDMLVEFQIVEDFSYHKLFTDFIQIKNGEVGLVETVRPESVDLSMQVPVSILKLLKNQVVSWDEAHIGYWCRFWRSDDRYFPRFWRMLQAPYFQKYFPFAGQAEGAKVTEATSLQWILDNIPLSEELLRRSGMNCHSCGKACFETLADGMRAHGIEDANAIIAELNIRGGLKHSKRNP